MNLSEIYLTEGLSLLIAFAYTVVAINSLFLMFAISSKIPKHLKLVSIITGLVWIALIVGMLLLGSLAEKILVIGFAIPILIFAIRNLFNVKLH